MTYNDLLIVIIATSGAVSLAQRVFSGRWRSPGTCVWAGLLSVLAIACLASPPSAGWIAAGVAGMLLVTPSGLSWLGLNAWWAGRYRRAMFYSRFAAILRPWGPTLHWPPLIRAWRLMDRDDNAAAEPWLARIERFADEPGAIARSLLARLRSDWSGCLRDIEDEYPDLHLITNPIRLSQWIHALGEVGDRERMLLEYHRQVRLQSASLPPGCQQSIILNMASLLGEPELLRRTLPEQLRSNDPDGVRFQEATALQVAGETQAARIIFEQLQQHGRPHVRIAARNRLMHPLPPRSATPLSDEAEAILRDLPLTVEQLPESEPPIELVKTSSWWLACLLFVIFLCEIPGGTTNPANLDRLGALEIPTSMLRGEYWRIVTAAFLHYGFEHFIVNAMMLLIFGIWLERTWGRWPTAICFLLTSIGSTGLAALVIPDATPENTVTLLGSSGGVLGIVGALWVRSLRRQFARTSANGSEFLILTIMIVLRVVIDLQVELTPDGPAPCFEAHLLGMLLGGLWAVVVDSIPRPLMRLATDRD